MWYRVLGSPLPPWSCICGVNGTQSTRFTLNIENYDVPESATIDIVDAHNMRIGAQSLENGRSGS